MPHSQEWRRGKIKSLRSPDPCYHWILQNPYERLQADLVQVKVLLFCLFLITQERHCLETVLDKMMMIGPWWQRAALCPLRKKTKTQPITQKCCQGNGINNFFFFPGIFMLFTGFFYALSPSKVILPLVAPIITVIVILFLYVFTDLLHITVCLCVTQRIWRRSEHTVKQTHTRDKRRFLLSSKI